MQQFTKQLEYCTYCPKMCRHSCPVAVVEGSETLTPQSKMELLNMLRRNAVPWEADFVKPLFACNSCRLCTQFCAHGIDVATILQEGRGRANQHRLLPTELRELEERFRSRNAGLQEKIRQEFSSHLFAEDAQVGFFPGCDAIDKSIQDVRDALQVFDSLDLNFVRLAEMPYACFGYPLWAAGCFDAARFVAAEMIKAVRRFATLVVGCPACAWLLREKLPAEGFEHNTEVLHTSEFLHVHAERLDVRQRRPEAFYHDPCYLGRYLGAYEPPRRLMQRCVDSLKEFFYTGEEGECCGGGGMVPHTFPTASKGQANRRLEEAALFDVPLVVTSCPSCKQTLSAADSPVEVMELVNLLAWAIQDPKRPAIGS